MVLVNASSPRPVRKRDVVSRVCAAVFGGYAAASAVSMLMARLIPLSKPNATTAALLSTPILLLAAILWAFAARSPSRAWLGLGAVGLGSGMLVGALVLLGGRT